MKKQENKNPEQKEEKKIFYKVILIGDSLVGKTCLFKKLTKGIYTNKNISTIGMDQKTISATIKVKEKSETEEEKEVEKNFTINLWDTAGQERFRSITSGYFKESHGLILLYDITNRTSFDNLEKWMTSVTSTLGNAEKNENNKKYSVILLGNKVDLEDKRKVSYEEAEEKCRQFNIYWGGECSVQEMTLEELNNKFEEIIKEIYRNIGDAEEYGKMVVRKLSSGQRPKKKKSGCKCI